MSYINDIPQITSRSLNSIINLNHLLENQVTQSFYLLDLMLILLYGKTPGILQLRHSIYLLTHILTRGNDNSRKLHNLSTLEHFHQYNAFPKLESLSNS